MDITNAIRLLRYLSNEQHRKSELAPGALQVALGFSRKEYIDAFEWLERSELVRNHGDWIELTSSGWDAVAAMKIGGMRHDVTVSTWQDEALLSVLERTAKLEAKVTNGLCSDVSYCKNEIMAIKSRTLAIVIVVVVLIAILAIHLWQSGQACPGLANMIIGASLI